MQIKAPTQAEKIVEAACRLFGTQRFHEVRMDDVAAAADVGKGTLYRYFQDKEELYAGLLAHATAQFRERMHAEVEKASGARARLEALVQAIIDYFDEHLHLKGLIQRAEAAHDEGKRPFVWNEARADALRLIGDIFQAGRLLGEFEVRDPELAAMMLLGGIRSIVRDGVHPRPADLAPRVVESFLWGAAAELSEQPCARRRPANGTRSVATK